MRTGLTGQRLSGCAVAVAAILMLSSPGAQAAPAGGAQHTSSALRLFGHTVLAAVATSGAGDAATALRDSIALLDARYRIQAQQRSRPPEPAPPQTAGEVASDPSSLPPASAGNNGSIDPHASSLHGAQIFAHTRAAAASGSSAILLTGIALAPPQAPEAVKGAINAANTIVGRPYIWGGGHRSFYSNGYDCSGSVSFALFGGGLIPRPLTSGELEHWGAPGPGKWITVYANGGHTFAEIAGLRWDTVGDAQGTGPRWHLAPTSTAGFVVRHPPGY
jgi:cell wall-associated NlpC family hydrolase